MQRANLELFWGARAGRDSKGICHMVTKGGIVCMLLNRHQLYGIVAELCNSGQHIFCEQAKLIFSTASPALQHLSLVCWQGKEVQAKEGQILSFPIPLLKF